MEFVNREVELARLEAWWDEEGAGPALVWGRRRVGKTALLQRFAAYRRVVFHTGTSRPLEDELRILSREAAPVLGAGLRDLATRPFRDWDDALDTLAEAARSEPLLLVLDEFPELERSAPDLQSLLRAFWDRARGRTRLRLLLCGSAVRTMQAMLEARAPLHGRVDLRLQVHPFGPHEAARMLPGLSPADRALVWGLVGGTPQYLGWWDAGRSVRENLARLVCTPGGRLLTEGEYVLATEGGRTDLPRQVLHAIAAGRTKFNEIEQAVRTNPARTLDDLVALRLVERLVPVTEDPARTRRRIYRIADNFLAFWLGVVSRYRAEIERGLGESILPVILRALDDHMGPVWEEAYRLHLRRLAAEGRLGEEVVAVGRYWTQAADPGELDAVVLAGRSRRAVLVGEAKWTKQVDARPLVRDLARKAAALPRTDEALRYSVCARERVTHAGDALAVTAADIFGG